MRLWYAVLAALVVTACAERAGDREASGRGAGDVRGATARSVEMDSGFAGGTRADRAAWRERLDWPDSCEEAFQLTHIGDNSGLWFHTLEDGTTVVQVRCAAGAYQGSSVIVRLDERVAPPVARTLTFTTHTASANGTIESAESVELWGEVTVLRDGHLTLLSVSRQTRDCGTWSHYAMGEGAPRLVEFYAQVVCPAEAGPPAQPEVGRPPEGWTRIPMQ